MNKQIRELAEQAGYGQVRWNSTAEFEQFMGNFSELIIQECLGALSSANVNQCARTSYDVGVVGAAQLKMVTAVKEHFEIEF